MQKLFLENEILIIQTSDSSRLIITKDFFPNDDGEIETSCYSIREGDNPVYWTDCWNYDVHSVINLIEFPYKNISCNRDYISWWLNCKPIFVHETIKPILKQKLEFYHATGEIKKTFINANLGLEFNLKCLIEWHNLLGLNFNQDLIELIPKDSINRIKDISIITINFEGFHNLHYHNISFHFDKSIKLQMLLDNIYVFINKEVPAFSYEDKWILYNSTSCNILKKENNSDYLTLEEMGIKSKDKIICYKK